LSYSPSDSNELPSSARNAARAAVLHIRNASKTYFTAAGQPSVALRPVDTDIREGEFVSFVGPSGCGKTTLLKMSAGLISRTTGDILFKETGKPIPTGAYGFVFQSPALLPWRTALQNVMLPSVIFRSPLAAAEARARDLLRLVQLPAAAEKYPRELSGGMQQRVAIARALIHDPDLLFMDEPFGALDAMTRDELNLELQRIQQQAGKTVVFVTHDIEEAVMLSDRILVFSSGPGRLIGEVVVDLPRPRTLVDRATPAFGAIATHVREMLSAASKV
jgi:NitT/TauT family transport system ATP-binding protein